MEELQEYWSGLKYSPYDAYLPPNIDDFIFVWLASQILVFYLFLTIGISYLLKRKKLLTKQDNAYSVPRLAIISDPKQTNVWKSMI